MAIKKSELYSSLWEACDELRGSIEPAAYNAWRYKDYVLVLLFIKYVSDKYAGQPFAEITVPEGASFADLVKLKGTSDIGDQINKRIIAPLAEANDLGNLPDFNDSQKLGSGKEMQDRLTNLIAVFEKKELDFSRNRADGDDILGDAYEYLMRHFASESGKSKGQFYTPSEVSRIMALVLGIGQDETSSSTTVYDPTCGSGSLLLKVGDADTGDVTLYGQEYDNATAALAQMNMILHDNPTAQIMQGNTLSDPKFMEHGSLKTFDYVVANPPFSDKRWSNGLTPDQDVHERFQHYGTPPDKQGDYAYMLHIIRSLKSNGKAAVILPHGVLFRGNAEETIRKNILKRGYIKAIIGLPANLFYGTGIPVCIIVLDKEHAASRKGIFMIDASKGFIKDDNKNRLRSQDIHKIVDVFNKGLEIEGFSRLVPVSEISDPKNDYNLNLPRYIDSGDEADIHDLTAHLKGGIPKRDVDELQRYWNVFTATREALFKQNGSPDYLIARVPSDQVKSTILDSSEYQAYAKKAEATLTGWKDKYEPYLKSLKQGCKPKDVIWEISEDLLSTFEGIPLIDKYDVYQHLMIYWSEVMQDDVYQISGEGWKGAAQIRLIIDEKDKDKKVKESPDIVVGTGKKAQKFKAELIPPALIVQRYFADDKQAIDALEAQREPIAGEIEELTEEHSGEEGLLQDIDSKKKAEERLQEVLQEFFDDSEEIKGLEEIKRRIDAKEDYSKLVGSLPMSIKEAILNKNGSAGKGKINAVLKQVKSQISDTVEDEEVAQLKQYIELELKQKSFNDTIKAQQLELDKKTVSHYAKLDVDAIKELVVIDKWFDRLSADVAAEVERVTQVLANRVKELEERYAHPMPELTKQVSDYSDRVEEHLNKMGLSW